MQHPITTAYGRCLTQNTESDPYTDPAYGYSLNKTCHRCAAVTETFILTDGARWCWDCFRDDDAPDMGRTPVRGLVHIGQAVAEATAHLDWPVMAQPDYTDRASCLPCHGTGELGVYREQETNEWVTVPCSVCDGTGDAPAEVDADLLDRVFGGDAA